MVGLKPLNSAAALLGMFLWASPASATILFSDNFDGGASAAWGDQSGDWRTTGGVYDAGNPDNSPITYTDVTTLPGLTDFSLSVDVNSVDDGGVWLRSSYNAGSISGVLLVTGGSTGSNNGLHWHTVVNGAFSGIQQAVGIPIAKVLHRRDPGLLSGELENGPNRLGPAIHWLKRSMGTRHGEQDIGALWRRHGPPQDMHALWDEGVL